MRKKGCKCGRKFRRFLQLLNQIGDIDGGLSVHRRPYLTQIWIGVEGRFKLLSIDLSVLIQNMCINSRNHIDLSVTSITLGCLQVTVIQLELVGSAGMPQRVENYVRQFSMAKFVFVTINNAVTFFSLYDGWATHH